MPTSPAYTPSPLHALIFLGVLVTLFFLAIGCATVVVLRLVQLRKRGQLIFNQVHPLAFGPGKTIALAGIFVLLAVMVAYGQSWEWARAWLSYVPLLCLIVAVWAAAASPQGLVEQYGLNKVAVWKLPFMAIVIVGASLVIIYPANMLTAALLWMLDYPLDMQGPVRKFFDIDTPGELYFLLVFAILIAPLAEEILFRGLLHPLLKARIGLWAAIFFSALVFALIHFHLPATPALFLLAVIMSLAYEFTGSLAISIFIHMFFNATTVGLVLLMRYLQMAPPPV